MRLMDKANRPDIADELEAERANALFGQLEFGRKAASAIGQEISRVQAARTLDELHAVADDLAREKALKPVIAKLRRSGDWNDLGALKRDLIDFWVVQRNALLKRIVKDIEAQREAEGG